MGGLHVDLKFPPGTDKSVHAFLKNAYFKMKCTKKVVQSNSKEMYKKKYAARAKLLFG